MIGNDEFLSRDRDEALIGVKHHLYCRLLEIKERIARLELEAMTPSTAVAQRHQWSEATFLRELINLIERS